MTKKLWPQIPSSPQNASSGVLSGCSRPSQFDQLEAAGGAGVAEPPDGRRASGFRPRIPDVGDAVEHRHRFGGSAGRRRSRRADLAAALRAEPLSKPWRPLVRPFALRAIALRRRFPPAALGEPIGEPRQELRRVGGCDPSPRGSQQHVDRHLARRLLVSAPGLALVVDPRANPDFAEPQIAVVRGLGGLAGVAGGLGVRRAVGRVLGCPLAPLAAGPDGRVVVRRRRGEGFFLRKRIGRGGRARLRVSPSPFFRLFLDSLGGAQEGAPGPLFAPPTGARPPRHRR